MRQRSRSIIYYKHTFQIRGEREPEGIFRDFIRAFEQILDSDVKMLRPRPQSSGSYRTFRADQHVDEDEEDEAGAPPIQGDVGLVSQHEGGRSHRGKPLVIWIIGGPGSDKLERTAEVAKQHPTWRVISAGQVLLAYLQRHYPDGLLDGEDGEGEADEGKDATASAVKKIMRKGDMAPQGVVLDHVLEEMDRHADAEGFFITGFPRDIVQARSFEERSGARPPCVLIDCSELELGRNLGKRSGRLDDNVDAYRRRLELYRELTLPMLRSLDEQNRLRIVDGDSDHGQVLRELRRCLRREVGALRRERAFDAGRGQEGKTWYISCWSSSFAGRVQIYSARQVAAGVSRRLAGRSGRIPQLDDAQVAHGQILTTQPVPVRAGNSGFD